MYCFSQIKKINKEIFLLLFFQSLIHHDIIMTINDKIQLKNLAVWLWQILGPGKVADERGNLLLGWVDVGGVDLVLVLLQVTEDGGETGPDEVPLLAQPDGPHLQPAVGVSEGELESLQFSVSCLVSLDKQDKSSQ